MDRAVHSSSFLAHPQGDRNAHATRNHRLVSQPSILDGVISFQRADSSLALPAANKQAFNAQTEVPT